MNNTYTDIYGNVISLDATSNSVETNDGTERPVEMVHCELCDAETNKNGMEYYSWHRFVAGGTKYVCRNCYNKYRKLDYSEEHSVPFVNEVMEDEIGHEEEIFKYGFELETEIASDAYYRLTNDERALLTIKMRKMFIDTIGGRVASDGSLSNDGHEFISNPKSERRLYKDMEEYGKDFLEEMSRNNFVSHNCGRCGLHFHVSKCGFTREDYIERILCILDNFKDEIKKYSRRNNFRWCGFISDKDNWEVPQPDFQEEFKTTKYYKDNMESISGNNHGMALNIRQGKPTIEFRVMRGTLKYESFMASFEFIKNIVELANSGKALDDITWGDLVVGEFARPYAEEYELTDYDKKCIDYTNSIAQKLEKKLEYERKMLKVLETNVRTLMNAVKFDKSNYDTIDDVCNRTRDNINELYALQNFANGVRTTQNAILSNRKYCDFLNNLNDALSALDGRKRSTKILKNKIEKIKKEFDELGVMNAGSSN